MRHAWLLDVLTDLRGFARIEGYDLLADRIDEALHVAKGEIAAQPDPDKNAPPDLFVPRGAPVRRPH